jgi:hypothetical protein
MRNLSDIICSPILDSLSDDNLKFLHPVGVSTFRYGVSIPLEAQTERLRTIEKDVAFNQADFNGLISAGLMDRGWQREQREQREQRVVPELGLKCDFEKNGVWVEVEFGNARSYYQDYVKFMLARKYRAARLGLLLCPTTSFAALLCELGQRRARENSVAEKSPVYSGMMSYRFWGLCLRCRLLWRGLGWRVISD